MSCSSTLLSLFPHRLAIAAACITLAPIAALVNILMIASFIATKQVFLNTSNFLIICVGLSDLIMGAVSMPILASSLLNNVDSVCSKVKLFFALRSFGVVSAILTVLIAIDRYLHMNPNIERRQLISKLFEMPRVYTVTVIATFGTIFLNIALLLFVKKSQKTFGEADFILCSLLLLSLLTASFLYVRGYIKIRNFTNENPIYTSDNGTSTQQPQYVRKLFQKVLVLIILGLISYAPYGVSSLVATSMLVFHDKYKISYSVAIFVEIGSILIFANGIANSFVVLYFNDKARKWIFATFRVKTVNSIAAERSMDPI